MRPVVASIAAVAAVVVIVVLVGGHGGSGPGISPGFTRQDAGEVVRGPSDRRDTISVPVGSPSFRRLQSAEAVGVAYDASPQDQQLQSMPVGDVGELDPFAAVALTRSEFRDLMKLYREGTARQHEIDLREQQGEISLEEHSRLSARLNEEMDAKLDELLGADRAEIFADVAAKWAEKALPAVLEGEVHVDRPPGVSEPPSTASARHAGRR